MRQRKPSHLFVYLAPIRRERRPVEIVKTNAASILRHEPRTCDEAVRLAKKQFTFGAGAPRSVLPYKLCSDKMLFGQELHRTSQLRDLRNRCSWVYHFADLGLAGELRVAQANKHAHIRAASMLLIVRARSASAHTVGKFVPLWIQGRAPPEHAINEVLTIW
jgi:hypothetical protein